MDDLLAGDGRFIGFNGEQIDMLEADLARAQKFIAVVRNKMSSTIRPGSVDADTETKLNNIFHMNLDATDPFTLSFRRVEILQNVSVIERGLKQIFPFQGEPANALGRAAFVSNDFHDQTMHIQENYFDLHQDDRAVTLIHERAHTVLKASGHPGSGDVLFCVVPDQGITAPPIAYSDAIRNAYCYELISLALQPDYNPARFRQNPQCLPLSMTGG